jgi:hypothetical protein
LEIVQLQQIKSSIQKTKRIESHGLGRRAVAEIKIHTENNLKVQLKWGSNIFEAYSYQRTKGKTFKRQKLAASPQCLTKICYGCLTFGINFSSWNRYRRRYVVLHK